MKKKLGQKGQSTVEAIVLTVVIFLTATVISNYFQENNILSRITQEPWSYVAGMIEGGVWLPADRVKEYHPSQFTRVRTIQPTGEL